MNPKLAGFLRHVFTLGGGYLVAKGKLSVDDLNTIGGLASAAVGLFLSYTAPEKRAQ